MHEKVEGACRLQIIVHHRLLGQHRGEPCLVQQHQCAVGVLLHLSGVVRHVVTVEHGVDTGMDTRAVVGGVAAACRIHRPLHNVIQCGAVVLCRTRRLRLQVRVA